MQLFTDSLIFLERFLEGQGFLKQSGHVCKLFTSLEATRPTNQLRLNKYIENRHWVINKDVHPSTDPQLAEEVLRKLW